MRNTSNGRKNTVNATPYLASLDFHFYIPKQERIVADAQGLAASGVHIPEDNFAGFDIGELLLVSGSLFFEQKMNRKIDPFELRYGKGKARGSSVFPCLLVSKEGIIKIPQQQLLLFQQMLTWAA